MAMLGSDIWVLQFDGGSRGKKLSMSYNCSNLYEFFIGYQVLIISDSISYLDAKTSHD
jgi:hypothetical protein